MIQLIKKKYEESKPDNNKWYIQEQVKTLLWMLLFVEAILIFFSIIRFLNQDWITGILDALAVLVFFYLIFLLYKNEKYYPLISSLFILVTTIITTLGFVANNFDTARIPWFLAIIVLAHYLQESINGIRWSLVYIFILFVAMVFNPANNIAYLIGLFSIILINVLLFMYGTIRKKDTDYKEEQKHLLEKMVETRTQDLKHINDTLELRIAEEVRKNREKDKTIYQQEKMIALGDMINNIAHHWRQPLSVISTSSTAILFHKEMGTLNDDLIEKEMNNINNYVQKLSKTIDTFDKFLINDKKLKEVVLQDILLEATLMEKALLQSHNIKLSTNIDDIKPIQIVLDIDKLLQVIRGIIINAKEVLCKRDVESPWIKIELQKEEDRVLIMIEDNGGGIPDDIMPKIFEPYFTTKHQFSGTGLGLHLSYKIITESFHGALDVENSENGAKFLIKLPLNSK